MLSCPPVRKVEECLVCRGRELEPFAMASGHALLHTAQGRCRRGGPLLSPPPASAEGVEPLYPRPHYQELWPDADAVATRPAYEREELPLIKELAADWPLPPGGEAIEVGCGYGEFLDLLREGGLRVRGCEVSDKAIDHCRGRGHDVVR